MDSFIMPVSKPNDPQAVGSAITYAKRYALAGILALNMFFQQFTESGVMVMGTYMLAQLLIVMGIRAHFFN
jgi:hypothetical protein